MSGTQSWFENPTSKVSAHFGISLKGEIWQWVALSKAAWANGILENPDVVRLAWLAVAVRDKLNPNWLTVSIEHEGDSDTVMPEAQYQASLALNRWLVSLAGLKAGPSTIVRHSQITGIQRAACPGASFPMVRLLKDLGVYGVTTNDFIDPVTKIAVSGPIADFYKNNGGLTMFGRPISVQRLAGGRYGAATEVQWFERSRFELLPDKTVILGLVGFEAMTHGL